MAPALKRTRMRGKQPPLDPRIKLEGQCIKKVYLVTIAQIRATARRRLRGKQTTERSPLRSPADFSREQIEKIFLDVASRPVYEDSRRQRTPFE
jgi:hypothetical protein